MKQVSLRNESSSSISSAIFHVYDTPDLYTYTNNAVAMYAYGSNSTKIGFRVVQFQTGLFSNLVEERKELTYRLDFVASVSSSSNVTTANNEVFIGLIYEVDTNVYRVIGLRVKHITYTSRSAYTGIWDVNFNTRTLVSTIYQSSDLGNGYLTSARNISIRLMTSYVSSGAKALTFVTIVADSTTSTNNQSYDGGQDMIDALSDASENFGFFGCGWNSDSGEYIVIELYKVIAY